MKFIPFIKEGDIQMKSTKDVGAEVKEARKAKNITLKQLSAETGLSVGYLSNLERGLCSPTLDNLDRICQVLEVSIRDLLSSGEERSCVVRREDCTHTLDADCATSCDWIQSGPGKDHYFYMTIQPNTDYTGMLWTHVFDEMGTVIQGEMEVRVEDATYHLREGDSVFIKALQRHSCYNLSDKPSRSFWVQQKEKVFEN